MAKLVYLTNASLDGYIEDTTGALDLYTPDDRVFAATTELLRGYGTLLYGRRLYESMAVWETDPALAELSDLNAVFARTWRAPEKIVYSRTLSSVPTRSTRIEREFDPAGVRELKEAAASDLLIGGAEIAAQAFAEGLIDEYQVMMWPAIIGGGKPALPSGHRIDLDLIDEHRFANGVVYLRYGVS